MAIIKCKVCGGDLQLDADRTLGICEYCGSPTTLPKLPDDQRAAAFNRGNHFRRIGEFDKALSVYERIVQEDETDAEAHWCCALCRFGIEYVEDPATMEYVPTCHRASFDSFLEDVDYLAAVQYSEGLTRRQYQKEAAKIAELQKGILVTSQNEQPFDVFICYKESDEQGQRTKDSMLAQDIYYQLTDQGFRVFFSRITLEHMGGTQYEPYIFAALNSAKVMIVVGTKPEHMDAVWVKNEWSRFLVMMKKDRRKLLLPCYRDMDPYTMPEQLSVLQSYDMAKIGFIQDLTHGIKKVLQEEKAPEPKKETVVLQQTAASVEPLLKRAFMFLEDGDWERADQFCEQVLNQDPENARAYLGKLLAELKVRKQEALRDCPQPFDRSGNYQKILRFGDEQLKAALSGCIEYIKTRNENARLEELYNKAKLAMTAAGTAYDYKGVALDFSQLGSYKDSAALAQQCMELSENARKDAILLNGKKQMNADSADQFMAAKRLFESIPGWKDADYMAQQCQKQIDNIHTEEEAFMRRYAERLQKIKNLGLILGCLAAAVAVFLILIIWFTLIHPSLQYDEAVELMNDGKYAEALSLFMDLGDYKDAEAQRISLWDQVAQRDTISAGDAHTVALKADGTVVAVGNNNDGQCNVSNWTDIVAVSAGKYYTIGLKRDGTAVAVGWNLYGSCNISSWTDIIAISAGAYYTVGLKADGTAVAVGDNDYGQCDVSGWTDIVAISAGEDHTIGLKADGTIVAVGNNNSGQCDASDWKGIKTP